MNNTDSTEPVPPDNTLNFENSWAQRDDQMSVIELIFDDDEKSIEYGKRRLKPHTSIDVEDVLASGLSGIAWAGGVFGVLLAIALAINYGNIFVVPYLIAAVPVSLVAGLIIAGLSSLVIVIVFMLFHWSIDAPFGPRLALSFVGSGSGFLATAHITGALTANWTVNPEILGMKFPVLVVVAMLLGHIGAILAVKNKHPGLLRSRASHYFSFRFSIGHMLIVTAWAAFFSWLATQFGEHILVLLLVGLVCQIIIACCDYLWCRTTTGET